MSAEVQDLAVCYGAAWAAHDLDAIMALHTEDTVFHLHGDSEPAVGWSAAREAFAAALDEWPDIRFERRRVHVGSGHFGQ
jgi:ketosteroid isomerase-like protein